MSEAWIMQGDAAIDYAFAQKAVRKTHLCYFDA